MTTGGRYDGRRWVECSGCDTSGPIATNSRDARALAKAAGWSRRYYGSGEDFFCPECRAAKRGRKVR